MQSKALLFFLLFSAVLAEREERQHEDGDLAADPEHLVSSLPIAAPDMISRVSLLQNASRTTNPVAFAARRTLHSATAAATTDFLSQANSKMTSVPVPDALLHPANIPEKQLFGPGPSNMAEEIRNSLGSPLLGHLHPEFTAIMDDCKAGLQYLFQTNNRLTFAVSGTGHAGMECALMNLLEPGETFLVVQNGIWGQRAAALGRRLGLNVQTIMVPEGKAASLAEIETALNQHKPAVIFVCHGESSTGVAHPLEGIGELCKKTNTLFLVDTVASIGGAEFNADELGVDCVYSATQKVLNAPPGLAPISFSARAEEKIRNRKTQVVSWYFDALELGNYWGCFDEPRRYHHTGIISLVYSLRASLALLAKEGLEHELARHADNAKLFHKELNDAGFKLFVEEEALRLPCLTTIAVPNGVDWKAVADKLMQQHKIEIAGGLGPTAGKIWRIGTFGVNSDKQKIQNVVKAFKAAVDESMQANL